MCDSEIDELIVNLAILAKLKINNKLSTTETSYLNIQKTDGMISGIIEGPMRWFYGEGRDIAIKKIDLIITKGLKYYNEHNILVDYLKNAIIGLENLKATYINCTQTNARLDVIIDKINRELSNDLKKEVSIDNLKKKVDVDNDKYKDVETY
jgi:hypothetical protein